MNVFFNVFDLRFRFLGIGIFNFMMLFLVSNIYSQDYEVTYLNESLIRDESLEELKDFYYIQDTLVNDVKPLMKISAIVTGKRHQRLDNYYDRILKDASYYNLNAIKVDSSHVDKNLTCHLYLSLYSLNHYQVQINEADIDRNLIVVFGRYYKGHGDKKFKMNGRKMILSPFEYVKRYAPIGKKASINMSYSRAEILGKEDGIEYFVNGVKSKENNSFYFYLGGALGGMVVAVQDKQPDLMSRGFGYFLMNIYEEKFYKAKTLQDLIDERNAENETNNSDK